MKLVGLEIVSVKWYLKHCQLLTTTNLQQCSVQTSGEVIILQKANMKVNSVYFPQDDVIENGNLINFLEGNII